MRRALALCLILCVGLSVAPRLGEAAAPPLEIRVNGTPLRPDVPPFIEEGRTLVPLRAVFQALGAQVEWDPATRTVTGTRRDRRISLTVDAPVAYVGGQPVPLAVPARIRQDRTFVPLRFVAEALGAWVDYDAETRTVQVIDLDYLTRGRPDPAADLLRRAATAPAPAEGDLRLTLSLGPSQGAEGGLQQTLQAQVRGAEGYARLDQELTLGGSRIQGSTELVARGGQVYLRVGSEPWQALGAGSLRLHRLGLPGGLDPMRLLHTPLIGAVATVALGPPAPEGDGHRLLLLTFAEEPLRPYFVEVARGYGVTLEGVTFDSLKGTLEVREADGRLRRAELQFAWKVAGKDRYGTETVTPWQLRMELSWSPPAGAVPWPQDLPAR